MLNLINLLEKLITSKTRLKLLIKFFVNISNEGYLNGLAHEFGDSTNSIRKELNQLYSVGYLKKIKLNNKIIYSANEKHPLFKILQKIVRTHLGLDDIVTKIISKIGNIDKIILVGDYAKGLDSGIIEIILKGEDIDEEYLNRILIKLEKVIARKIKYEISDNYPEKDVFLIL